MGNCTGKQDTSTLEKFDVRKASKATDTFESILPPCDHCDVIENVHRQYECLLCGAMLEDEERLQQELEWKTHIEAQDSSCPEDGILRGVSIGWLLAFTAEHYLWQVPTWVVRRDLVFPATRGSRCRFVELPEMRAFVGRASTYVSHCWGAPFGLLAAALMDGGADPRRFVWIDLFAVRQWPSIRPDLQFEAVISQCSSFMIVSPFDEKLDSLSPSTSDLQNIPKSTLTTVPLFRLWCLAELNIAARIPEMVVIIKVGELIDTDDPKMKTFGKKEDSHMLLSLLHLVQVNVAHTSLASDKTFLLDHIQNTEGGVLGLLHAVRTKLISSIYCGEGCQSSLVALAAIGDAEPRRQVLSEMDLDVRRQYFCIVARCGYFKLLMDMLESCYLPDINAQDDQGCTACILAAEGGHTECLQALVKFGCDVDAKNAYGRTACMLVSKAGHSNCLQTLLEHNCNVNTQDNNGMTACMYAARNNHANCLELLIAHHSDVNASDTHGMTASMHAAHEDNFDCLSLLIQNGCSLDQLSQDSWTACMYAADSGANACLRLLVEKGCSINVSDEIGMTACMLAAQHGHVECLETLMQNNCDIESRNAMGRTASMHAAQGNHDACLHLLLEHGCEVDVQDHQGMTACIISARKGNEKCLRLLLEYGCDVDVTAKNGMTAFMYASANGCESCMELLLKNNCDTQIADHRGRTAFMLSNDKWKGSTRSLFDFDDKLS